MKRVYYLLMQRGQPIDVATLHIDAVLKQRERSLPAAPVTILAVVPVQTEFDLEEPTLVD